MEQTGSFLSRRKLLLGLGGIAAGAVAALSSPFRVVLGTTARDLVSRQPALRRMLLSLGSAGYGEWLDQVGSTFLIGAGTSMKLVAVTPFATVGTRPAGMARDRAFLAKFDVLNGGTLPGELIYTAMNPSYSAFQIFLSASSDPRLPHRMTAVFN